MCVRCRRADILINHILPGGGSGEGERTSSSDPSGSVSVSIAGASNASPCDRGEHPNAPSRATFVRCGAASVCNVLSAASMLRSVAPAAIPAARTGARHPTTRGGLAVGPTWSGAAIALAASPRATRRVIGDPRPDVRVGVLSRMGRRRAAVLMCTAALSWRTRRDCGRACRVVARHWGGRPWGLAFAAGGKGKHGEALRWRPIGRAATDAKRCGREYGAGRAVYVVRYG
jgi:hypothetical protein